METDLFQYKKPQQTNNNKFCPELQIFGNHLGPCSNCYVIDENKQNQGNKKEKNEQQDNEDEEFEQLANQFQDQNDLIDQFMEDYGELKEQFIDCECCKGYVFHCPGKTCQLLGECYCYHNYYNEAIEDIDLDSNENEENEENKENSENQEQSQEQEEEVEEQEDNQLQQNEFQVDQDLLNKFGTQQVDDNQQQE